MDLATLNLTEKELMNKYSLMNTSDPEYCFFLSELYAFVSAKFGIDVFKIEMSPETIIKLEKEKILYFFTKVEDENGHYYRRNSKEQQLILLTVSNNK